MKKYYNNPAMEIVMVSATTQVLQTVSPAKDPAFTPSGQNTEGGW